MLEIFYTSVLPSLVISYVMVGVFFWKLELGVNQAIEKVVSSSKNLKKQRDLLESVRTKKNILRYVFWPITLLK
jgi:CHASE3 domain sensor protein|tara:strand:- start:293 stop:514 length:222 start_codon:yes stop_codon:yes gene_type:complete